MGPVVQNRVCTGHGKPGKSWNLKFHFLGLESHGIELLGLESHVKLKICIVDKLLQMTKQG